jgi:uncharacterized membrane protein YidH (DUF202 family)
MLLVLKMQYPGTALTDTTWLASIPQAFSRIFYEIKPSLLILAGTAWLWWLGSRLAYVKLDFVAVIREFQFGVIALIVVFVAIHELNLDQSGSISAALVFFAVGLLGVAISNAQDSNWLNSQQKKRWSAVLLLSVGVILVFGILAGLIFSPALIQFVLKAAVAIGEFVGRAVSYLAGLLPHTSQSASQPTSALPAPGPDESQGIKMPEWLQPGLNLIWEIFLLGFLLFAIWRIASRIFVWLRRRSPESDAEVEVLKGGFQQDFAAWFKKIIAKILKIGRRVPKRGRTVSLSREAASIYHVYEDLLQWAAKAGYPRQKTQTPEEFRTKLNDVLGGSAEDLSFITRSYMDVRFGAESPTQEKLGQLREKWHNLRKSGFVKKR